MTATVKAIPVQNKVLLRAEHKPSKLIMFISNRLEKQTLSMPTILLLIVQDNWAVSLTNFVVFRVA